MWTLAKYDSFPVVTEYVLMLTGTYVSAVNCDVCKFSYLLPGL